MLIMRSPDLHCAAASGFTRIRIYDDEGHSGVAAPLTEGRLLPERDCRAALAM